MALADIRTSMQAALAALPGIGIVTDYEPLARREEDLKTFFLVPALGYILGWSITREATPEENNTLTGNWGRHLMVVRGYRAIGTTGVTEKAFQDLVEVVRARLRQEQRGLWGGACILVGPPSARVVAPHTFSDVLVHYAEITQSCVEAIPA